MADFIPLESASPVVNKVFLDVIVFWDSCIEGANCEIGGVCRTAVVGR